MSRVRRTTGVTVAVLGILGALGYVCFQPITFLPITAAETDARWDEASSGDGKERLKVEVIRAGSIAVPALSRRYRGTVRPRRDSRLAFRRSGRIESIHVHEGDVVEAGEVMASLDVADLQSRLRQAVAARDSAAAALDEALAGPRKQTIAAANAEVRRLKAQLGAARNRQSRQAALLQRGAGSQQEVDNLGFEVERLVAEVDASQMRWDELSEGTRVEQIAAARASLAVAEAAVGQVEVDLADSQVVAPFPALVAERMVDEGTIASPLQVAVRLVEVPPYEARFGLPADLVAAIKLGKSIAVDTGSGVPLAAKVIRLHPTIDLATRTRAVDLQFPPDAGVVVGQTVTALIQPPAPEEVSNAFWIPTEALVRGSRGLWSVMAVVPSENSPNDREGVIERRNVRVRRTSGALSEVVGMIQPGDSLVASGTHRVGPGVRVVPVPREVHSVSSRNGDLDRAAAAVAGSVLP